MFGIDYCTSYLTFGTFRQLLAPMQIGIVVRVDKSRV